MMMMPCTCSLEVYNPLCIITNNIINPLFLLRAAAALLYIVVCTYSHVDGLYILLLCPPPRMLLMENRRNVAGQKSVLTKKK